MRLTQKNEYFEYVLPEQNVMGDNQASEISLVETEYTCKKYVVGEAINKLGELEDILESWHIENLEELKTRLHDCQVYHLQNNSNETLIHNLKNELAEKERQYETLYKLFSEQHELIDQHELECFEEVNRLLKEQKDFYVVEKTEYDKMKQGAKDIVKELKQQLADKEKVISNLNGLVRERDKQIKNLKTNKKRVIEHKNKNKISFTIEKLEKVKEIIANHTQELWTCENDDIDVVLYEEIDNQIKKLKEMK